MSYTIIPYVWFVGAAIWLFTSCMWFSMGNFLVGSVSLLASSLYVLAGAVLRRQP